MRFTGGGSTIPNATTTTPGAVTLAGDLGGTGTVFSAPRVGSLTGIAGVIAYSPNGKTLFSVSGTNLTIAEDTWASTTLLGTTIGIGNAATTGGVTVGNAATGGASSLRSSVSLGLFAPFTQVGGVGDTYPVTGRIRLPNNNGIYSRSTLAVDIPMIEFNSSNQLVLGATTVSGVVDIRYRCTTNHIFSVGATTPLTMNSSGSTFGLSIIQFDGSLASATLRFQGRLAAGAGGTFTILGQNASGAGNNGGPVAIMGGASGGGAGAAGTVRLESTVGLPVAEFGQISTTQRVVSFCRAAPTTTTHVTSGDLTIFVGNAATNPTTNPTLGFQLYSVSGAARPGFFGAAGMLSATATAGAIAAPLLVAGYWVLDLNGNGSVKIPYYNT